MTWTPRNPVRWGASDRRTVAVTLGSITVESDELVRVEGPAPATWHITGQVLGVDPADQAGMVWRVLVELGIGSFVQRLELPFSPSAPFTLDFVPAQWLSVRVRAVGPVAVGGSWFFGAGAAPNVPWEGIDYGD